MRSFHLGLFILSEEGTVLTEFDGVGVQLTLDKIPTEEFSVRRRVYWLEVEPDLPTLFEKQTEYLLYMKGCPLLNTFLSMLKFDYLAYF